MIVRFYYQIFFKFELMARLIKKRRHNFIYAQGIQRRIVVENRYFYIQNGETKKTGATDGIVGVRGEKYNLEVNRWKEKKNSDKKKI